MGDLVHGVEYNDRKLTEHLKLEKTLRWYGPQDPVTLSDIKQAGASGVVTALHDIAIGDIWPLNAIQERAELIRNAGLTWHVVESIAVHEDIKLRAGSFKKYISNYCQTISNLSQVGVNTITYNFMPVMDWTRTDLNYRLGSGARTLRFDMAAFAAFDICILKRQNASASYSNRIQTCAKELYQTLKVEEQRQLQKNIISGLPGGMTDRQEDLNSFRTA
ncbi:MAG: mannonate dehydratase, partial [Bacteroidota bacterium]